MAYLTGLWHVWLSYYGTSRNDPARIRYFRDRGGCGYMWDRSIDVVRSHRSFSIDPDNLAFQCFDGQYPASIATDPRGGYKEQALPLWNRLYCPFKDNWHVCTTTLKKHWYPEEDMNRCACIPRSKPNVDLVAEAERLAEEAERTTERINTLWGYDAGIAANEEYDEPCTSEESVNMAVEEIQKDDPKAGIDFTDLRLIGWVTDYSRPAFVELMDHIWVEESGPLFNRHRHHYRDWTMYFDDVKDGHSYKFCGDKQRYKKVQLNMAYGLKSFGLGGSISKRQHVRGWPSSQAWKFIDGRGRSIRVPSEILEQLSASLTRDLSLHRE